MRNKLLFVMSKLVLSFTYDKRWCALRVVFTCQQTPDTKYECNFRWFHSGLS